MGLVASTFLRLAYDRTLQRYLDPYPWFTWYRGFPIVIYSTFSFVNPSFWCFNRETSSLGLIICFINYSLSCSITKISLVCTCLVIGILIFYIKTSIYDSLSLTIDLIGFGLLRFEPKSIIFYSKSLILSCIYMFIDFPCFSWFSTFFTNFCKFPD